MQYPKPPPKPDEVRAGQRKLAAKRDAAEERAAADSASQLGGDQRESFRIRQRDRLDPGYADRQARTLDDETERRLGLKERSHAGLLERSIDYWGAYPDVVPMPKPGDAPVTTPRGGTTGPVAQASKPQAAAPLSGDGGGSLADVPWRKRRVAPQGMTRAAQAGELSRLLGV